MMPIPQLIAKTQSTDVSWYYVAACVVLPFVWGLIIEAAFRLFGRKRREESEAAGDESSSESMA